jgi:GAF domain-containing protein
MLPWVLNRMSLTRGLVIGGALLLLSGALVLAARWAAERLTEPLADVLLAARRASEGELSLTVPSGPWQETHALAEALNCLTARLNQTIAKLEGRVSERTFELQQRTEYLEAANLVSQVTNTSLEPDKLMQEVADTIQSRFGLYYVGLFLLDETQGRAILQAGTGAAGKAMRQRGHAIEVDKGMIGWSISHNCARVALQAETDQVRLLTPELPETRSEAAIPLRSRGRVIGALSVQSSQPNAFDSSALSILQTMADTVAVAIDNAHLFSENAQTLASLQGAYQELSRTAWNDFLAASPDLAYRCDAQGVARLAFQEHAPVAAEAQAVSLPIQIRGQTLGTLQAAKPDGSPWTEADQEMLTALVGQLSIALDSARLYQETQRRAERERLAGEITAKLRASNDPQEILRTAVAELRQALRVNPAQISIQPIASPTEPTRPAAPRGELTR